MFYQFSDYVPNVSSRCFKSACVVGHCLPTMAGVPSWFTCRCLKPADAFTTHICKRHRWAQVVFPPCGLRMGAVFLPCGARAIFPDTNPVRNRTERVRCDVGTGEWGQRPDAGLGLDVLMLAFAFFLCFSWMIFYFLDLSLIVFCLLMSYVRVRSF
jgi:hypothetical protein